MHRTRILQQKHALEHAYKVCNMSKAWVMQYIEGMGYAVYRRQGLCSISNDAVGFSGYLLLSVLKGKWQQKNLLFHLKETLKQ